MYILLCAAFPALRALWYCDSNMPCIDKIYYLSHRTMVATENSQNYLNDERPFGSLNTDRNLIEEGNIVLGSNINNSADNDDDEIVLKRLLLLVTVLMMNTAMMKHRHQVIQPCHLHVRLALEQMQATH
jgi:hypothetical protein